MIQESGIDLLRYPLNHLGSPEGCALVAAVQHRLKSTGCALLPGFIRRSAVAQIQGMAAALTGQAHFNRISTNPYSSDDDPAFPEGHPRRTFTERTNGFVAGDMIAVDSPLRSLYHSADFQRFVATCLGRQVLWEYADPLAGLVLNILRPGCQHPWHFDNTDFVVALMIQPACQGGVFEYCPHIRSPHNENYEAVGAVLAGDATRTCRLRIQPGDLQIFHGRHSLHRVTSVEGSGDRYTAILAYADRAGVIADATRTRRLFGRVTRAHMQATNNGRTVTAVARDEGAST